MMREKLTLVALAALTGDSKVQIAVLPLGTESGVLGNMLQTTLGAASAQRPKR